MLIFVGLELWPHSDFPVGCLVVKPTITQFIDSNAIMQN